MRHHHLCLLSLLLLPLLLPATSTSLLHRRALQANSDAHEFKLKPKDGGGGGNEGGGGGFDMSNQRVFTLASGPSRRGDGHK
ncbi:hypothetical protein SDJN03_30151, partial [Cucurbita argyrosperma subsp. sororia]